MIDGIAQVSKTTAPSARIEHATLGEVEPNTLSLRGFAKLNKFQKSKNNLEVGGWVQVSFG